MRHLYKKEKIYGAFFGGLSRNMPYVRVEKLANENGSTLLNGEYFDITPLYSQMSRMKNTGSQVDVDSETLLRLIHRKDPSFHIFKKDATDKKFSIKTNGLNKITFKISGDNPNAALPTGGRRRTKRSKRSKQTRRAKRRA